MKIHHTPFTEKSPVFLFFLLSLIGASTFPLSRRLPQMILRLRHEYLPAGPAEVAPPRRGRNCSGQTCLVSRSRRDGGQVSFPRCQRRIIYSSGICFHCSRRCGRLHLLSNTHKRRVHISPLLFFPFHPLVRFVFCSRQLIQFHPVRRTQASEHRVIALRSSLLSK